MPAIVDVFVTAVTVVSAGTVDVDFAGVGVVVVVISHSPTVIL
jgi:hypothetical protein